MKKMLTPKSLKLTAEAVRVLQPQALPHVVGGVRIEPTYGKICTLAPSLVCEP